MIKFHSINSLSNPIFKDLRVFVKNGTNKQFEDLFCVAGIKNNLVALENNLIPHSIFIKHDFELKKLNKIKTYVKNHKIRWIQLSTELVNILNNLGNGKDVYFYYEKKFFIKQSFPLENIWNYALCDNIQEPNNLGAIIRNAAAFNIKGVFLWQSVNVWNPKVIRASAGNIFALSIAIVQDIKNVLNAFKNKKLNLIGFENSNRAKSLINLIEKNKTGIVSVFGNEGHGLSKILIENIKDFYKIDINKKVESLNVATASAIVFYELNKLC